MDDDSNEQQSKGRVQTMWTKFRAIQKPLSRHWTRGLCIHGPQFTVEDCESLTHMYIRPTLEKWTLVPKSFLNFFLPDKIRTEILRKMHL